MHEKDYYYKVIGKNLYKYRNFADLTQEKIADALDSSNECISRIENPKSKETFSLAMIGRISDYIGIPIWYLWIYVKFLDTIFFQFLKFKLLLS